MRTYDLKISEKQRSQALLGSAGLGALLLVVSLFLTWYSYDFSEIFDLAEQASSFGDFTEVDTESEDTPDLSEIPDSIGFSGWSSLGFADAVLLFAAISAVLIALARRREAAAGPDGGKAFAPMGLLWLGLATLLLMLVILFTKNSIFGSSNALVNTIDDEINVPIFELGDLFSIKTGIGVYVAFIGSILITLAGLLDSMVKAVGPSAPSPAPAGTAAPAPPAGGVTQAAPVPNEAETQSLSPPGWHPDPHGVAKERYWDGTQWTEQTR